MCHLSRGGGFPGRRQIGEAMAMATRSGRSAKVTGRATRRPAKRHLQDIELFIQWDSCEEKTPEEKLEEAICLHMHMANQRE